MFTFFLQKYDITSLAKIKWMISLNSPSLVIFIVPSTSLLPEAYLEDLRKLSRVEVQENNNLFVGDDLKKFDLKIKTVQRLCGFYKQRRVFLFNNLAFDPFKIEMPEGIDTAGLEYVNPRYDFNSYKNSIIYLSYNWLNGISNTKILEGENYEMVKRFAKDDEGILFYYLAKWKGREMFDLTPCKPSKSEPSSATSSP